ncbi:tRNA epoxyqueuosine(34) reductase QueG [Thermodesulfobacteriota bacterium]
MEQEVKAKGGKTVIDIKKKAEALGFIAVGFGLPRPPLFFDNFLAWINDHRHADMSWLERHIEIRANPERLLEGSCTIISLAYPYSAMKPSTEDGFSVARYSQPREADYHSRLKKSCLKLVEIINSAFEGSRSRIFVDAVPLLERSLALSAGIGFIGKNNMLIIPGYGSYFYIAEILTTAPLEFLGVQPMESQCGECRKCIDACPSGALERSFFLNASRCLSYLTIESRDPVDRVNGRKMGDCFFGCDRCQEVCPFNREEMPRDISLPSTDVFIAMGLGDFDEHFGHTSFTRAGLEKLKTNIAAIRG